jgi:hypothetical protein
MRSSAAEMTPREIEGRLRFGTDFEHYAPRGLKVRAKSGATVPFGLNQSQRYLHHRLEAQRARTGRVRALVLKGRQVGISTYIGGRFYWRATHSRGYRAFIVAHMDSSSDALFGMAKRYHDNCPELIKPTTGASNAKELAFPKLDSGYKVATAGSKDVGRGETIQLFHGSEVAFWPNAETHFAGVMQALAQSDGTEAILESTANGIGNVFHKLWKAAERGESDFEAIFIPWFWHEEYTATPPDGWMPPGEHWLDYEAVHQITRGQTYWAWCKNRDLVALEGGSTAEIGWKFKQEYPSTADEAFQTSGAAAFIPPIAVLKARKFVVYPRGPIVIGVDPARGGDDKTGIIDRQGRRMGWHVCRRLDSNDLMSTAGEIVRLATKLRPEGLKKIVIDTTGLGAGLYDRLREQVGDLVLGVNFAERALEPDKYSNRRAEIWDLLREWFDDPAGVQIPDSDDLQSDVCAPMRGPGATRFDSAGRLVLESKEHIKERLTVSPDLGDAAALTFAVDFSMLADRTGGRRLAPNMGTQA